MRNIIYVALLAMAFTAGCGNGSVKKQDGTEGETTAASGMLRIQGTSALSPMINIWVSEYIKDHPGIQANVTQSLARFAVADVLAGQADIAIIARPLTKEEAANGLWSAPVAVDALVPVISFDNSCLQPLVINGLSPQKLKEIFSGQNYTWGQLTDRNVNGKVKVFVQSDSSDNAIYWNGFLGLQAEAVSGSRLISESALFDSVAKNKNGIGYCSMMSAYDKKTGLRKEGIYILPIDFNKNGIIDDAEHLYDNYKQISNAVSSGKMPFPPGREYHIVTSGKPAPGAVQDFVKWLLTIGQNLMPDAGYIHIPKNKADKALESMK